VFLPVAVLGSSRRLFVKAFLSERGPDWRDGNAAAFQYFEGVPRVVLGDNARALVVGRHRATGTVSVHPAYLAFCRDGDVQPRACAPYRARTKGKTEAGVTFVTHNALAGLSFDSFAALQQHLAEWLVVADQRRHGTTREAPIARFDRDDRAHLRPLPDRALPRRAGGPAPLEGSGSLRSVTTSRPNPIVPPLPAPMTSAARRSARRRGVTPSKVIEPTSPPRGISRRCDAEYRLNDTQRVSSARGRAARASSARKVHRGAHGNPW
jgi:hypothetical protein